MSFIPFSFGSTKTRSSTDQQQTASSFVDPGQAPFLDFLRNTAQSSFPGFQQGAEQLAGTGQQLFQQGQALAPSFTDNQFLNALGAQAGGNPDLVAAQTQQLGSDLGQFLSREVSPFLTQSGIQTGQLGQGRENVARGVAAGDAADAFQRGAVGLQAADAQRAQQAAATGGQLFGQGAQGQANLLAQQFAQAQGIFSAGAAPLQQFQGLIGGPTVLDQSQATSTSRGSTDQFDFGIG